MGTAPHQQETRSSSYWRAIKPRVESLREKGAPDEEIKATLMAEYALNDLAAWRFARGFWTRRSLVDRCRELGYWEVTEEGLKYAEGKGAPSAPALAGLEAALGVSAKDLGYGRSAAMAAVDEAASVPYATSRGGRSGRSALSARAVSLSTPREDPMEQPGPARTLDDDLDLKLDAAIEALTAATVSPETLESWQASLVELGRVWESPQDGAQLQDKLMHYHDKVTRELNYPQRDRIRHGLCRLAGQLNGLLGLLLWDQAQPRRAAKCWHTAVVAAGEAGDPVLHAWVLAGQGNRVACTADAYSSVPAAARALELSGEGLDLLGERANPVGTMLMAVEARACAARGDLAGARKAMAIADRSFEQAMADGTPPLAEAPSALTFAEPDLAFYLADTYLRTGDVAATRRYCERSLEWWGSVPSARRVLTRFALGSTYLLERDLEQACAVAADALTLDPAQTSSPWIIGRAMYFATRELTPYAHERPAREFGEQVRALVSQAVQYPQLTDSTPE